MKLFWLLCFVAPLMAQTELYLPWAPQNETFQTKVIITNHEAETASVQLQALRNGDEQDTVAISIEAFDSYQATLDTLFPLLGPGSGAVVTITSQADNLTASAIVASTTTDSGNSPAQMNAIPRDQAAFKIAFHHLPILEDGFSAPVIVNVSDHEAQVTIHGFKLRESLGTVERTIAAGEVFAEPTQALFPDAEGDLYLIAESNRPILGSTFLFNSRLEPSMAAAERVENIPDPMNTFTEIQVWPSSRIRVGESTVMNSWGQSIQRRPPGSINHLLTWINDSPDLIDLVTEGDDAGKVTAKKAGNAMIRVQARGGVEVFTGVTVLGRPIQLAIGSDCNLSLRDCNDWEALETPKVLSESSPLDPSRSEPAPVQFFRTIGDGEPLRIKELIIDEINSDETKVTGKFSGLEVGQVIGPGETVVFSVDIDLLVEETQTVLFKIILETNGTLLYYYHSVTPDP